MNAKIEHLPTALASSAASSTAVSSTGGVTRVAGELRAMASAEVGEAEILGALAATGRRIAPLYPLDRFVAVNPYMGLAEHAFSDADRILARSAGSRLTMAPEFYAAALLSGRISARDLREAREEFVAMGIPVSSVDELAVELERDRHRTDLDPRAACLPSVAELVADRTEFDWPRWLLDGLATTLMPWFSKPGPGSRDASRSASLFTAWLEDARLDARAELSGVVGTRARLRRLPRDPKEAACFLVSALELGADELEPYLLRLAMSMSGWSGVARHRDWEAGLRGSEDGSLAELLILRMAWDWVLLEAFGDRALRASWAEARRGYRARLEPTEASERKIRLELFQRAYERGWQRPVEGVLAASEGGAVAAANEGRPWVQAAFCIDVRSERLRRALESLDSGVQTIGFAGFFGFALEYRPVGVELGSARCPGLLAPPVRVEEGRPAAGEQGLRARRREVRATRASEGFKAGAISTFTFVEAFGLGYLAKLLSGVLARPGRVKGPGPLQVHAPEAEQGKVGVGMTMEEMVSAAEGMLRGMSLVENFAPVVALVGHGSTSRNNPHASGLQCGACGGHAGDVNARVAAEVLNRRDVREALVDRGISVPASTHFVAGCHDTTTDELRWFDVEGLDPAVRRDLDRFSEVCARAGTLTRRERAPTLGVDPAQADAGLRRRARGWAMVRPEWGLAGCAGFIVAPRARTRGLDLQGRCFLHDYEERLDPEHEVLRGILNAPLIVGTWINLQYYASRVDPERFGSGDKVLHNAVGALGVVEGSGGELRGGLPLQSVRGPGESGHEPLRLTAYVEAERDAVDRIVSESPDLRALLEGRWFHLYLLDEAGVSARWTTRGWEETGAP